MIKKIITQIKSVNKYGVVAVLIATSLVAFKAEVKQSTVKWRPNYNTSGAITGWTNVNSLVQGSNYDCDASVAQTCTAQFQSGTTPTATTPIPTNRVDGEFN
ncbi:hypothetical protein SAMN06265348_10670 [Pedobacter westerhofensis]|uniref:Uncharacterized protein n=1 Tax=Pedobacter westerhofensis TaxID=425512 RepID=A0A521DR75_9SPHI|nr:hypothetical protein [Pedobacter westerhofensis]SMO73611.1 hypothetical protein SAMN06265348_10670 [Pedobacter westerhofensis]